MINPHAIRLLRKNFAEIQELLPHYTDEFLVEVLFDSTTVGEIWYIVFRRAPVVGTLMGFIYTEKELRETYDVETEGHFYTLEKLPEQKEVVA